MPFTCILEVSGLNPDDGSVTLIWVALIPPKDCQDNAVKSVMPASFYFQLSFAIYIHPVLSHLMQYQLLV
jgi:hypothetical protein